jgi:hypothetical protein
MGAAVELRHVSFAYGKSALVLGRVVTAIGVKTSFCDIPVECLKCSFKKK